VTKANTYQRTLGISLGWMIFSALLYFVLTSTSINVVYDPFTILGISPVRVFLIKIQSKLTYSCLECNRERNQEVLQETLPQIVSPGV
jgi:preprotein translocase subunit Sec63